MRTYREAIRTALAVHAGYRACAASEYYDAPQRPLDTVQWCTYWYGDDPRVFDYDAETGASTVADVRTYRALAVLLRLAPIGGRSYLGMPLRTAVAVAFASAAAGVALAFALPSPTCDDGQRCMTPAEYAETVARLEAIRETRTGGRFDVLAQCAETNGAPLTVDACTTYLAERSALAAACGAIAAQDAYERCEAATLAAIRN